MKTLYIITVIIILITFGLCCSLWHINNKSELDYNSKVDSLNQVIRNVSTYLYEIKKINDQYQEGEKKLKSKVENAKAKRIEQVNKSKFSISYETVKTDSSKLQIWYSYPEDMGIRFDSLNFAYFNEMLYRDSLEKSYERHIASLNKSDSLHYVNESALKTKIWVDSIAFEDRVKSLKKKLRKKDLAIIGLAGLNLLQAAKK